MRISDWSSDVCSSDLRQAQCAQLIGQPQYMRAFSGPVQPFKSDKTAALCLHQLCCPKIYLATARLWLLRFRENSLVPSPLDTKYRYLLFSGCNAANSEARPTLAIGVGGRPARV